MRSAWKRLISICTDDNVPPILIKYEIGSSGYSIWITDMTVIWIESLDRKRIIQRSFGIDTSIDPSEGSDQLRLFLQSVQSALEQREGTTLNLVQNGGEQKLLLRTCTTLPGSLKPLEWIFELAPAPQSTLTAELVVPMLSHQVLGNVERASLLQQLKEKDQVIAKLIDKMQTDGTDLGILFPGIASSKPGRPISRQLLGRSVKGLAEFDEQQWRNRLAASAVAPKGYAELVVDAFEHGPADLSDSAQIPVYNNWWERLRNTDSQLNELSQRRQAVRGDEDLTQGEFQRQPTPPKLKPTAPSKFRLNVSDEGDTDTRKHAQKDSDSTTDESEHEYQPMPSIDLLSGKRSEGNSKLIASPNASSPTASPFSTDKNRNATTPNTHQEGASSRSARDERHSGESSIVDDAANSLEDFVNDSRSFIDSVSSKEPAVPKSKAKLGKIGGKSKGAETKGSRSPANHKAALPSRERDSPLPQSAQKDLKKSGTGSNSSSSSRIERSSSQPQASSPPRESSQDRANRKRAQLKRELETKSNVGAKKKRRF